MTHDIYGRITSPCTKVGPSARQNFCLGFIAWVDCSFPVLPVKMGKVLFLLSKWCPVDSKCMGLKLPQDLERGAAFIALLYAQHREGNSIGVSV